MATTAMSKGREREFQARSQEVEELVKKLERAGDPQLHATALELVQSVIDLHGAALERLLELLSRSRAGEDALYEAVKDDLVASMFLLHGLHPDSIQTRVLRALDKVRPYLKSHGGDVELVSIDEGILRVQLQGTCGSCSSSALTLKTAVEDAVYEAAPDILEIIAENAKEHSNASKLVVLK
ncbi:MAG: NifU family protein [Acidobacteriaceae bacterium]